MVYFKITEADCDGPVLHQNIHDASLVLRDMALEKLNSDDPSIRYTFEAVEMTEEEFNNLPGFQGF